MNADEKVTTKADDRAHLVFLDGTSLTIGPNSEVVIDKYIYNPENEDRRDGAESAAPAPCASSAA